MKKLIIIPLLLISLLLSATTYYVKTGGDDSAAGTSDGTAWAHHPWMTTWTGSVALVAGDVVYMNRGDTWSVSSPATHYLTIGQSGTAGNYITTTAYGTGDKPIIKIATDTDYSVIFASGKSFLAFDNLDIQHWDEAYVYSIYGKSGIRLSEGSEMCHDINITNCDVHECPCNGIWGRDNCYNIVVGDTTQTTRATTSNYSNNIYNCGRGGVILYGANDADGNSNFYVDYNYIHDIQMAGDERSLAYGISFSASADESRMNRNCYARNNYIDGVPSWSGIDSHNGIKLYYQNNYIRNCNLFFGMQSANRTGLDSVYIEDNDMEQPADYVYLNGTGWYFIQINGNNTTANLIRISGNNFFFTSRPTTTIATPYGIGLLKTNNVTIEGNHFYNGPTTDIDGAIRVRSANENTIIRNNFIEDWSPSIKLFSVSTNGNIQIYNNIIKGFNYGIWDGFSGTIAGDWSIYNNTIMVSGTLAEAVSMDQITIPTGKSLNIKNNIIGFFTSTARRYIYGPLTITGTFACDNNLYWNTSSSSPFSVSGATKTLTQWSELGYDVNSPNFAHGDADYDPMFKGFNMWNHVTDFDIKTISPAVNAGVDVGLTHDKFGFEIIGLPDIGAVESRSFRFYVK